METNEIKPTMDEMKTKMKEDYKRNADRLKKIPDQNLFSFLNLELTEEDLKMKTDSASLIIDDFKLRIKYFKVIEPRYDWESKKEWMNNQKSILDLEIKKAEFNIRMHTKSLSSTQLNTQLQLDDIEAQRKRCKDAHKVVLKRLLEECKVSTEEYSELKKNCTFECCR